MIPFVLNRITTTYLNNMSKQSYWLKKTTTEVRYRVCAQEVEALSYICDHPLLYDKVIVFNKFNLQSLVIKKSLWQRLPNIFDQALRKQVLLLEEKGRIIDMNKR